MSDNKKHSRREILQLGGLAGFSLHQSLHQLLLDIIVKGLINSAAAEETGTLTGKNYINMAMLGGPLRYSFDQWIRTNPNDPQLAFNIMTSTRYTQANGKWTGVDLGYFNHNGVLVPHLFSQSVTLSSGEKNISELLKHMVVMRGYGTGVDGHPTNYMRQVAPVGGLPSLVGMAAEAHSKIFDAIRWPASSFGAYSVYNSSLGKSLTGIESTSPAHNLLEGFAAPDPSRNAAKKLIDRNTAAVDLAKQRLASYSNSDAAGAKILSKNHANALALIKRGTSNLESFWPAAVARYTTVINAAVRKINIPGISDVPLIYDENIRWENNFTEMPPLPRSSFMWQYGAGAETYKMDLSFDLRRAVDTAAMNILAEGLALCEFVLKEQLSSSLDILISFMILHTQGIAEAVATQRNLTMDMHETPASTSVFLMNQYYRALMAGVLELIEQLKNTKIDNKDIWSNTVIHFTSEFGRSARSNGSGSDHGFNQMISSALSGDISNGPHVVGNVLTTPTVGTQGIGAPIENYNQKGLPTPAMMASTVAALLKISPNPYANIAAPLVEYENGVLKVKFPGKLIVG